LTDIKSRRPERASLAGAQEVLMWNHGWMMGLGWGPGGWGFPIGGLFWLLLLIALFVLVARAARRPSDRRPSPTEAGTAEILDARYAKGEIGRDEYLQKKADISSGPAGH